MKILRRIGIALGVLVGLLVVAVGIVLGISEWEYRAQYVISDSALALAIPSDAASLERGRHLVADVLACVDCHGPNLAGKIFVDDPALGRAVAANLTHGKGGLGGELSDADFVRAIRHGVKPDGTSMFVMPVNNYLTLSRPDLAAVIAYVKSVPPVDNELPPSTFRPIGRGLQVFGQINLLSARKIDHTLPFPDVVPQGSTLAYGHYLAQTSGCIDCHNPSLSGGPIADTPPDWPPAANITPGGEIGGWTDAEIDHAIRDGQRPSGKQISSVMPWKYYHHMTDEEIQALITFLRSVPPKTYEAR